MSTLPTLSDDAVVLGAQLADWRAALRLAGELLSKIGATDLSYGEDMVRVVEEHGPYIVIAPGLALAHAKPGPSVYRDALVVVTLAEAIDFVRSCRSEQYHPSDFGGRVG